MQVKQVSLTAAISAVLQRHACSAGSTHCNAPLLTYHHVYDKHDHQVIISSHKINAIGCCCHVDHSFVCGGHLRISLTEGSCVQITFSTTLQYALCCWWRNLNSSRCYFEYVAVSFTRITMTASQLAAGTADIQLGKETNLQHTGTSRKVAAGRQVDITLSV
jgi:hypothetical protein